MQEVCCPCAPAAGRGEDGHWAAGLPWHMDTSQEGVEMDVVWGSCCGVRGCVPVPGAADPADGGSWAKLESANPSHGALHARAWNYSWQMELPAIVPWGEGHSRLFPISVRGLYSPDTPRGDVLQKSWYRVSFHHHHLNIHRKGK